MVMMGALEEAECLSSVTAMSVIEEKIKWVDQLETNRLRLTIGRNFIDNRYGSAPSASRVASRTDGQSRCENKSTSPVSVCCVLGSSIGHNHSSIFCRNHSYHSSS